MNPAPPTRSRSESRPISRTIRPDAGQEYNGQYPSYGTPTITEDQEAVPQQRQGADVRKKSSASNLQRQNAGEDSTMAPSLLPAETRRMPADYSSFQDQEQRPTIRKQMSADPAAMYRQHQQQGSSMPTRDRLPSRHASERRPSRDHNQSSGGNSPYLDSSRDDDNRFRADRQQGDTRGRSQTLDEDSTRNGFASSWAKSRSKSKDPSSSRQTPENPSYPEYNPALIPTRNTSSAGHQRAKSVPRKPSNQNLSSSDNWTPLPMQQQPAHGQSMTKPGLTLPPFGSSSKSGDTSTSHHGSSLNANTNANTTYHEKMIRGMGMGSTPIAPTVLLTPQPSFPTTSTAGASPNGVAPPAAGSGGMRNIALAMMKQGGAPSSSEVQLQQRQQQLQQVQMQHLQQQQQRLAASVASSASPPDTPTSPRNQTSVSQASLPPPAGAAAGSSGATAAPAIQRLVATRIYIQTETDFKSISLAPNTTALDVLHMLQQRGAFGEPGEGRYHDRWTVFEYTKEFLIERPLRDFEVVLDVMKTWDAEKDNKMICKSFPARTELSAKEVLRLVGPAGQQSFVRPHGWVHLETKKSKWVRRYMHITDTAVYHSKDPKPNGESMLCLLRNFDVYAVQVPRKKAPTKFGFALKSSDSVHMFETPEDDYIHYICVESGESLREWLAGLRAAKGMLMYHTNPELVREGQRRANELVGSNDLSEEQMSLAEAKLAGLGMSMSGNSRSR
ncbi:hypothetical protein BGZ99_009872 [Dissophora globulifera]|uniref:PH domain-containing protein n=1 Tax=Dissophora globulifera TaxID=979702 RepID=A0A9P6R4R3_9FUNG|nr:hypothetical protein BGZ99_009872 [Dissophora globulifera]